MPPSLFEDILSFMLDDFAALSALDKYGTLSLAAAHLRVETSTVWKRINSLEKKCGRSLLDKKGRNIFLTSEAKELLSVSEPLIRQLKDVIRGHSHLKFESHRPIRVGVSESVIQSWGPYFLNDLISEKERINLQLSTHRGTLLLEKLRHGDFDLVICAGQSSDKKNLISEKVFDEELYLYKHPSSSKIYCIEQNSLSFEWLKNEIENLYKLLLKTHEISQLQSYGAIASIISSGMGGGVVPAGIALRFKIPEKLRTTTTKKMTRPIFIYGKKAFISSDRGKMIFENCSKIKKNGNKTLSLYLSKLKD